MSFTASVQKGVQLSSWEGVWESLVNIMGGQEVEQKTRTWGQALTGKAPFLMTYFYELGHSS